MATSLQVKLIKAFRKHLKTGHYKNTEEILLLIGAVEQGAIRITKMEDPWMTFDDCHGDIFCPVTNDDIEPNELKRQKQRAQARFRNAGGAYSFTSEFWTGREWTEGDMWDNCIGGTVGNDFFGSGYEWQIMQEALDGYNKQTFDENGKLVDTYNHAA